MIAGDLVKVDGDLLGIVREVTGTRVIVHDETDHVLGWPREGTVLERSVEADDDSYDELKADLYRRQDKARAAMLGRMTR